MSLGSRLIVLLFVTKVLGTCTCSCTWLKKIDVLDAIQVLQILFWTCTCKFEKYLTFTWLKYFRKYLTPTLPVHQSPCSFEICVPGRQKLWCAPGLLLNCIKGYWLMALTSGQNWMCFTMTYGVNLNVGHYQIHQCQKFCSQFFFQVHTLVACIEWWMNPGRLAAVFWEQPVYKHLPIPQTGECLTLLTHCGLVTPYGDIDLGQHWFR